MNNEEQDHTTYDSWLEDQEELEDDFLDQFNQRELKDFIILHCIDTFKEIYDFDNFCRSCYEQEKEN